MCASEEVATVQAYAEKKGGEKGGEGKARRNRSLTTSSLYARPRSSTIQSPAFRHGTKNTSNNDMFSLVLTSSPRHRRESVFAYAEFEEYKNFCSSSASSNCSVRTPNEEVDIPEREGGVLKVVKLNVSSARSLPKCSAFGDKVATT